MVASENLGLQRLGEERLRGDAESIGGSDADAAVTNVQRECAGMRHR